MGLRSEQPGVAPEKMLTLQEAPRLARSNRVLWGRKAQGHTKRGHTNVGDLCLLLVSSWLSAGPSHTAHKPRCTSLQSR